MHGALDEDRPASTPPAGRQRRWKQQFPHIVERQPELLAHAFYRSGLGRRKRSATGSKRAGGRTSGSPMSRRSANSPKDWNCCERSIESAARDAREVELLGPLGTAYIAARGYAAPEVGPIFHRARELARARWTNAAGLHDDARPFCLPDRARRFSALRGLADAGGAVCPSRSKDDRHDDGGAFPRGDHAVFIAAILPRARDGLRAGARDV